MRNILVVTLILSILPAISVAGTPIKNIIEAPVPIRSDGSRFSIDEVKAAVIKGSQSRTMDRHNRWRKHDQGPSECKEQALCGCRDTILN